MNIHCLVNFIHLAKQVILYSGRGVFHHGHYQECIDNQDLKYSLVEAGIHGKDIQTFVGLCLPASCSDEAVTKSLNLALKLLGTPISVFSINSQTENYEFELTWVSYLTIIIFLATCAAIFIATVRLYNSKEKGGWLRCFDFIANIKQHFKIREGEPLNVWDGVRAIAMMWVIIGHTYTFSIIGGLNIFNIKVLQTKPFLLLIEAGVISVDVFFMLGGFFLVFIMLRSKVEGKTCGLGIVHRALRIWPAFLMAMLFYYSLYMKTGSGMMWYRGEQATNYCQSLWRQVLFVSNFVENGNQSCMGWSWYLMVDFQLFILGVFLIYFYSKNRSGFFALSTMIMVGSAVLIYLFTFLNKVTLDADIGADRTNFFNNIYIKPYGHCMPYLLGVIFGIHFMEYRNSKETLFSRIKQFLKNNDIMRKGIQWTGIALMAAVVIIPRPIQVGYEWPQWINSTYHCLSKPVFIFGLFLTVTPSILGIKHSFFQLILTSKPLSFIARVSFCTYLVHIFVLFQFIFSRTYDTYYSLLQTFVLYAGFLPLCLFFGFILTIIVEVPFGNLLKKTMTGISKKQSIEKKSDSLLSLDSLIEEERQSK